MSSTLRTPPPTVSGMKQASAVRRTTSRMVPRFSLARGDVEEGEFVGARRVIGVAASTGSPASRRSTKFTPLTTRPSFTSRQGMTRTLNIVCYIGSAGGGGGGAGGTAASTLTASSNQDRDGERPERHPVPEPALQTLHLNRHAVVKRDRVLIPRLEIPEPLERLLLLQLPAFDQAIDGDQRERDRSDVDEERTADVAGLHLPQHHGRDRDRAEEQHRAQHIRGRFRPPQIGERELPLVLLLDSFSGVLACSFIGFSGPIRPAAGLR